MVVALVALLAGFVPAGGVARAANDTEARCEGEYEHAFDDVDPSNVHVADVNCLANLGVVEGVGGRNYNPKGEVARGQMATFIARAMEEAGYVFPSSGNPFPDDDAVAHHDNINRVAAAGVVGGYDDETYRPHVMVTRDQMAKFIARAIEEVTGQALGDADGGFSDVDGNVHREYIDALAGVGIVNGHDDGTYRPKQTVRRDQMAKFIAGFLRYAADPENEGGSGSDGGKSDGGTGGNTGGETGEDTGGETGEDTGGETGGETGGDTGGETGGDTGENRAPTISDIADQSSVEGETVDPPLTVSGIDDDGDVLTYTATGLPAGLELDATTGTITGTVEQGAATDSPYTVTVTVTDQAGAPASTTFTWTVVDAAPAAPVGLKGAGSDGLVTLTWEENSETDLAGYLVFRSETDQVSADGDVLTDELLENPTFIDGNVVNGTPYWYAVVAVDQAGNRSDAAKTGPATPAATNRAPTVDPIADQSSVEGDTPVLAVSGTDDDGDVLTYTARGLPAGLTIDAETGRIAGTVEQGAAADSPYSVTVTVTDQAGATVSTDFDWTVGPAVKGARIDLRVLLIALRAERAAEGVPEATREAWEKHLQSEGVPFDLDITGDADPITADELFTEGRAKYQGVIVTTNAAWVDLSDDERAALQQLQTDFGVRMVSTYVWPSLDYGLTPGQGGGAISDASLTSAGREVFPYATGTVEFDDFVYGYQGARPINPAQYTTLVEAADGSTLLGVYRHADGREELVGTVDMSDTTKNARLLRHGMLRWVTRGVYLGHWRNYLALHVDDILLADDRWNPDTKQTDIDGDNPILMKPEDVTYAKNWASEKGIRLDLVYNALGATDNSDGGALLDTLLANKDADGFGWINHTFTHDNLDEAGVQKIIDEIQQNIEWAQQNEVPITPAELVTGQHSGLRSQRIAQDNPALLEALEATGIDWIASDNSLENEQRDVGPALTVPRHPANLYYNVETWKEQLDEYNWIYFDGCAPIPGVHTCLKQRADWDYYVNSEATIMLRHVTGNDPRPHYLHQSNLAGTQIQGDGELDRGGTMYPVVNKVLDRYERLFSVPLVQPTQTEAGVLLRDRNDWNEAVEAGRVSGYLQDGKVHIEVSGDGAVRVPVTGTTEGDEYAGTRSGWVEVAGATTLDPTVQPGFGPLAPAMTTQSVVEPDEPSVAPPAPAMEEPLPLAPARPLEGAVDGVRAGSADR